MYEVRCCSGRRLKQGSSGPPAKRQRTGTPRALGKSGSKSTSSADELSTASLRIPSVTGGACALTVCDISSIAGIVSPSGHVHLHLEQWSASLGVSHIGVQPVGPGQARILLLHCICRGPLAAAGGGAAQRRVAGHA